MGANGIKLMGDIQRRASHDRMHREVLPFSPLLLGFVVLRE